MICKTTARKILFDWDPLNTPMENLYQTKYCADLRSTFFLLKLFLIQEKKCFSRFIWEENTSQQNQETIRSSQNLFHMNKEHI